MYVTSVKGQCDRWKCVEGAKIQGLISLRRSELCVPPPPVHNSINAMNDEDGVYIGKGKTYYSLRRHQSGRSFAKGRRM